MTFTVTVTDAITQQNVSLTTTLPPVTVSPPGNRAFFMGSRFMGTNVNTS